MNDREMLQLESPVKAKGRRVPAWRQLAVNIEDAAALVSLSARSFRRLDDQGLVPRSLNLGPGRVAWSTRDLQLWVAWGCPSREQFEARKAAMGGGR